MTVPTIPHPTGRKAIAIVDLDGGAEYLSPVTIGPSNLILADGLSLLGLSDTTAGVTDTTDKRFVTDQELADLVTLQPLAALEAVLAAIGAKTGAEVKLATAAAVDLNTATPTTLYTVPAGKSAVITRIVLRLASTSLTTVSISIGFNSASFNDVLANATHTELTGATLFTVLSSKAGAKIGAAADVLKLLCNTLQGGAATCTVDIFGYLY
jgi:hypothetical protein